MKLTCEEITTALRVLNEVRTESAGNPLYGFEDNFDDFVTKLLFLTPQSYGARLQAYLIKRFGLKPATSKDSGDFVDQFNQPHELKASLITPTNDNLNLVQIRPWQDVDYYCVAIDTRSAPYKEYVFVLNKEQMLEETFTLRATAAHGTKTANENNNKIELRMSVPIADNDPTFERWKKLYWRRRIHLNKAEDGCSS
jgi:hypothetical protein